MMFSFFLTLFSTLFSNECINFNITPETLGNRADACFIRTSIKNDIYHFFYNISPKTPYFCHSFLIF